MHCASCVYTTEKALKKIGGVSEAVVNLSTNKATVSYDSHRVTEKKLAEAVSSVGYQAVFHDQQASRDNELKKLKTKAVISLVIGGLILWGSFPGLLNTAPTVLKDLFVQFLLASIIQFWAGLEFYQAAIPALRHGKANMDSLVVIGTTVAYGYSAYTTFISGSMSYFDVSTLIIAFVLLGRYLEAKAKLSTSEAIKKLIQLQAKEATVLVSESDERINKQYERN